MTADGATGLNVYADGCFEPHSRTGGWAFVVFRDGREVASASGHVDDASSNAMEVMSVLKAVLWIHANVAGEPAVLWSDSVHAVNGCNQWRAIWKNHGWRRKGSSQNARSRPIADRELWIELDAALTANPLLQIVWCKGHSGIRGNERADLLAEHGRRSAV